VLVAIGTLRLSCNRAGTTRTLMPVWENLGSFEASHALRELMQNSAVAARLWYLAAPREAAATAPTVAQVHERDAIKVVH
jgi:hypothetical protein